MSIDHERHSRAVPQSSHPLKVLFTIAGLHPESGGPARSVPALCTALGRVGTQVEIVSHDYGPGSQLALTPLADAVKTTFVSCASPWQRRWQWSPQFKPALRERCRAFSPQLVHDTGIWLSTNRAAAAVGAELRIPRIVSPRGMLAAWALLHRGWKKRLAWALYQRRDLQSARLLHATSSEEARQFRNVGLEQPIAVIPNGVELPSTGRSVISGQRPGTRTLLFLGRIHPVKGLLDLVHAWAEVRDPRWRVVLAGGDENHHRAEVESAIRARGLEQSFSFTGAVDGEARWELYRTADLFVLPSHSENFGIVVAEALASGVPVITTHGTPWKELPARRCGWWVDIGPAGLAEALSEALQRPPEELREMGQRGREWVEEQYCWPGIAAQMTAVYKWVLGQGNKPGCVFTMDDCLPNQSAVTPA